MAVSQNRMNSGSNGQQESASTNMMSSVEDISFSHSSRYGEINVEGWYLVALAAFVVLVVV